MKVKVKSWNAIASWKWVVEDEDCGICRMPFDGYCVDCTAPGDGCPPVTGECNHTYHMHCIVKWLRTQQTGVPTCCLCRRPWNFKQT
mmetsp:Transcript_25355/g.71106  ORF Transcript_25355/g.71106 Transcript_25355/m.71106 type:complete len:87 (-) Transcript_25355:19-279(-)